MSKVITDARGLVSQPKDPYWDVPVTRREIQKAVNDLATNDMELSNRCDTTAIVLNFVLEDVLHIKDRKRLDAFVERKKKEVAELQAAAEAAAEAAKQNAGEAPTPTPQPEAQQGTEQKPEEPVTQTAPEGTENGPNS